MKRLAWLLALTVPAAAACQETTRPEGAVASVSVTPSDSTIDIGESVQLVAAVRDRAGEVLDSPVRWSSSDREVATVDDRGLVTPRAEGSVTIVAEADGETGAADLSVVERAVVAASVTPALDTIRLGRTVQLEVTLLDAQGRELRNRRVVWASANPSVAAVSVSGVVTGVASGAATISATYSEQVATAEIHVEFRLRLVDAGGGHGCGIDDEGSAYCWGSNVSGQLGIGTAAGPDECENFTDRSCSLTPRPVAGELEFASVTAGGLHTCALTAEGRAYCWGSNEWGQLGDGSTADRLAPVPVVEPAAVQTGLMFASIAAGGRHSCALTAAGRAYCWGHNDVGELGTGGGATAVIPTPVAGELRFVSLDAGSLSTCGVTTNGEAYCWGAGHEGQLGSGPPANLNECLSDLGVSLACARTPVAVEGGSGLVDISLGGLHACARDVDGAVRCWGYNSFGQLGDGSTLDRHTPVPVSGGFLFTSIAAGGNSCGLTDGGAAYCWGPNSAGGLGQGSTEGPESCGPIPCSTVPVPVAGGFSFSALSGAGPACGFAADGLAYCWGSNSLGQLGVGSRESKAVPTPVFGQ